MKHALPPTIDLKVVAPENHNGMETKESETAEQKNPQLSDGSGCCPSSVEGNGSGGFPVQHEGRQDRLVRLGFAAWT
jgi:hypothetical protein